MAQKLSAALTTGSSSGLINTALDERVVEPLPTEVAYAVLMKNSYGFFKVKLANKNRQFFVGIYDVDMLAASTLEEGEFVNAKKLGVFTKDNGYACITIL